jgi:hypothetical protein
VISLFYAVLICFSLLVAVDVIWSNIEMSICLTEGGKEKWLPLMMALVSLN